MASTAASEKSLELVVDIVAAYISNNSVPGIELPGLIGDIHAALQKMTTTEPDLPVEPVRPAVAVRKSVTSDYIVCLEDGKKFKSLKRHLRTHYDMSPEDYRAKWSLAHDYPMVAPNYARARSQLAKQMGLGQQKRRNRA